MGFTQRPELRNGTGLTLTLQGQEGRCIDSAGKGRRWVVRCRPWHTGGSLAQNWTPAVTSLGKTHSLNSVRQLREGHGNLSGTCRVLPALSSE